MTKVPVRRLYFAFLKNFFAMLKLVEARPPKRIDNMSAI